MNLQADSVQAVLFVPPGTSQEDASKLWGHIFPGDTPDGYNRNNSSPTLQSTATGIRDGYSVHMTAQVGRIDLILTAATAGGFVSTGSPPRLPDVSASAASAAKYLKQLASISRPIRVALVLDLGDTIPQGGEAERMRVIAPDVPFPEGGSDFLYQINVARKFDSVPTQKMNRLLTLHTGFYQLIAGAIGLRAAPTLTASPFVGVKVDVNSGQETVLDPDKITSVIDEIQAETMRLYEDGLGRLIG